MPEMRGGLQGIVGVLKDLLVVLRDGLILLVFVLLHFFPAKVNQVLTQAGFTKGTIAGFTWERELEASSEQAKGAGQAVALVEGKLTGLAERLEDLDRRAADPSLKRSLRELSQEVQTSQQEAQAANRAVKSSLLAQQRIIEQVAPAALETTGWLYLGKVAEDKSAWAPGHPATVAPTDPSLNPGTRLRIRDDVYLRGEVASGSRSSAPVLGVLRVGETAEVLQVDYSHAKAGGWFAWVKVRRLP